MSTMEFEPAASVLQQVRQSEFVAVIGPTAAGKTTLIKAAVARDPRLHMLVGGTSREPRPGERDGVDFHFGDKATMRARAEAGGYVTAVSGVSDALYTTAPEDYPAGKFAVLATLAHAVPLFRALPFRSFKPIFVVPPSYEIWQDRLELHGFDELERQRRLAEAERSFHFALTDEAVQFVVNATVETATFDLTTLAVGDVLSARQQADQLRGREIAQAMLATLTAAPA